MENHQVQYLGRDLCLVRTLWGGHVVVPAYNVDVAVGIIRDGIHEPWTTRLVQESLREESTYINVGANFGYYSSLGGHIVGSKGHVWSIEANPEIFAILLKTIMFAGIPDRITAYNRAAYNIGGSQLLFQFDYQFAGGGHLDFFGRDQDSRHSPFWCAASIPEITDEDGRWNPRKGLYNSFEIKTLAVDELKIDRPINLLHCDVEAAEPYVITGAQTTIKNSPEIRIIFEWSNHNFIEGSPEYRSMVKNMWDFLISDGFTVRRLKPVQYADGAIELTDPYEFEQFLRGEHGDYLASRM